MDSLSAFARGEVNRGKPLMVFDWDRAAQIIRDRQAHDASAGLSGDWEWTGGPILADGKPVPREETYVYLASTWATPELDIGGEIIDCWKHTDEWDAHTFWPPSALAILGVEAPTVTPVDLPSEA